jgi:hypothetical protein
MKDFWKRYQIKFNYAEDIDWNDVMQIVKMIFEKLNIIAETKKGAINQ